MPGLGALSGRGHGRSDVGALAKDLAGSLRPGDHVLIMSNGGFGGLHAKLLAELGERFAASGASEKRPDRNAARTMR